MKAPRYNVYTADYPTTWLGSRVTLQEAASRIAQWRRDNPKLAPTTSFSLFATTV